MNLKPLSDRILVKPVEAEQKTESGIIVPDTAKEKPMRGEVVASGPGKTTEDGKVLPMNVKVGDVVLYGKYSGTDFKMDNQEYLILNESDVLAIIES
jgi:chaperonin GroES